MIIRAALLLYCFLVMGAVHLSGQVPARAQNFLNEGLRYQTKRQPAKAEAAFKNAIKAHPAFTEAYSTLGRWYFDRHQYQAAAAIFLQAEKACANGPTIFAKAIAKSLVYSGDFPAALQRIPANSTDKEWRQLLNQARFMQSAINRKVTQEIAPFDVSQRINTRDPEMFPAMSADGQTFFFTRRVNNMDEDLYYAKRDSCGGWLAAKNMGMPPNSPDQESAQSLSADGHYLFMMRCENRSVNGWAQGGCDLYMAYTADSVWSIPLSFGATINGSGYEGMPSLSGDNRELFFVSDRPGGYGGLDIWSSRFEHGLWQMPRNLGPEINTGSDETAPFIYADNSTLYFASKGHEGMGGNDIFVSRKVNDSTWGKPVNLGWPINSQADEISLSLDAAADTAYFASDRDSIAGEFNIYKVALLAHQQPTPVTFFQGYVYDSLERTALNYANIYFTDSASGKEVFHVVSNRGDGSYAIALPIGNTYHLTLSRMGYQQMDDTLRSVATADRLPLTKHFAMLPFGYEKPVTDTPIATIRFKRNVVTLDDSVKAALTTSMAYWQAQKGITILVNGYTDNSGTPLLNEQFSFARAQLITRHLVSIGFAPEIIHAEGWGEANTLVENTSEENMDINRRVEIIIRR
jgi:outer membrane protein OmpA-like peptidoglycan-associated protein/Tol biopolymer transport system component